MSSEVIQAWVGILVYLLTSHGTPDKRVNFSERQLPSYKMGEGVRPPPSELLEKSNKIMKCLEHKKFSNATIIITWRRKGEREGRRKGETKMSIHHSSPALVIL